MPLISTTQIEPIFYTDVTISGSLTVVGQFDATSSWANNALYAVTAGFASNVGHNYTASFNNLSVWPVNHNLHTKFVIVEAYDTSYGEIMPAEMTLVDDDNLVLSFPTLESGYVVVSVGGAAYSLVSTASYANSANYANTAGTASYFSGSISNAISSSYALTASYINGSIENAISASYALTASYALNSPNIDTSQLVALDEFNQFTSSYQVDSASFDSRINNITSSATIDTSSFATIDQLNQFTSSYYIDSASFDARLNNITSSNIDTSSLATTGSNIFQGNQSIYGSLSTTSTITASAYLGDGRYLSNLSATTDWNYNQEYTVRNTEQLTFSGDYVLSGSLLLVEGSNEVVEYSPNKYFKKVGKIFIGGNLLVKDSFVENNGEIYVAGEVILIGNSQIIGTGTII